MWWELFVVLFGEYIGFAMSFVYIMFSGEFANSTDPVDSTFIKNVDFMFPENFLSRYPHEAEPFRLKIMAYLLFQLLVRGYGSSNPPLFWKNYNSDDHYRVAVDAAFYEYLTNFTDRGDKDSLFNPFENTEDDLSRPISNEHIAVDRIGRYLDRLSESESQPEIIKNAYDILSEMKEPPAIFEPQTGECDMQTLVETSGFPGIDYPNFCDVPKTSFSCRGKRIPGIYADYKTGCQAFHVCWPRRRDSFLCPIGTIFNQSLLTCDIWHDTVCFSSPSFQSGQFSIHGFSTEDIPKYDESCEGLLKPLRLFTKFPPSKCEVRDVLGRKMNDKYIEEFKARLQKAYDLILEMIQMFDKKSKEATQIHVLAKDVNSIPEMNTETVEDDAEFTSKLGDTYLKAQDVEQASHLEKLLQSGLEPGISVTRSSRLKPSEWSDEHIKSSRKQDVPDIVMRSLRLGGTILNEGVFPFAEQVMMDSYRKIESKNR